MPRRTQRGRQHGSRHREIVVKVAAYVRVSSRSQKTDSQEAEIKKWLDGHGIAADQVIMKSIALGWPDETFPANAVVSTRKSVDEAATFVGFE